MSTSTGHSVLHKDGFPFCGLQTEPKRPLQAHDALYLDIGHQNLCKL